MTMTQLERAGVGVGEARPEAASSPMRPLRVLRIITRLNIGGPAQQAITLSHRFEQEGWVSLLVVGRPAPDEGEMMDWLRRYPCAWIRIPRLQRAPHPVRDALAFAALLRVIWRFQPDVIHTHMAKAGTLGRAAGVAYRAVTRRQVQLVHTFHGHVLEGYFSRWKTRLFLTIERWLARRTDTLIAVNEAVRRDLRMLGIGRPERFHVVPLGLDLAPLLQAPQKPAAGPVRVGIVGRLVPIKDHDMFLHGIAKLRQLTGRAVHCRVIGDGPLRSDLEALSRQLGLERLVTFTGWVMDRAAIYEDLDIVCLTSRNEGSPVAVIEACAAARSVIATDVGGVRELLGAARAAEEELPQGVSACERGVLVRAGDADGFAHALAFLLERPAFAEGLGAAGRRFVSERFTVEQLQSTLSALYGRPCAKGASR